MVTIVRMSYPKRNTVCPGINATFTCEVRRYGNNIYEGRWQKAESTSFTFISTTGDKYISTVGVTDSGNTIVDMLTIVNVSREDDGTWYRCYPPFASLNSLNAYDNVSLIIAGTQL